MQQETVIVLDFGGQYNQEPSLTWDERSFTVH